MKTKLIKLFVILALTLFCIVLLSAENFGIEEDVCFYRAIRPEGMASSGEYSYVIQGSGSTVGLCVFHVPEDFRVQFLHYTTLKFISGAKDHHFNIVGSDSALCVIGAYSFILMDLSDPTNPVTATEYGTVGALSSALIRGNTLFTLYEDTLSVLNITKLNHPALIGTYTIPKAQKLFIRDQELFVSMEGGEYRLYDVRNPHELALSLSYSFGEDHELLGWQGSNLLMQQNDQIHVYNMDNPLHPVYKLTLKEEGLPFLHISEVFLQDELLIVRYNQKVDGLEVNPQIWYDATQPDYPIMRKETEDYTLEGYVIDGSNRFIMEHHDRCTLIAHDQSEILERYLPNMGVPLSRANDECVFFADRYVVKPFLAADPLGVNYDDLVLENLKLSAVYGTLLVTMQQRYGIGDSGAGPPLVKLHDARDPAAINTLCEFEIEGYSSEIRGLNLDDDRLYLLATCGDIFIYDIKNPAQPVLLHRFWDQYPEQSRCLAMEGKIFYFRSDDFPSLSSRLIICRQTDSGLEFISETTIPHGIARFHKAGNKIYLQGHDESTIWIYDARDPASLVETGSLIIGKGAYNMMVYKNSIIVTRNRSFPDSGREIHDLLIYKLTGPADRAPIGYHELYGFPLSLSAWGENLFIGTTEGAFKYDCSQAFEAASHPDVPPLVLIKIKAFPNPFSDILHLEIQGESGARRGIVPQRINIYNVKGQKVRSISLGAVKDGIQSVNWDGRDDNGKILGSGIYFLKADSAPVKSQTRKIVKY